MELQELLDPREMREQEQLLVVQEILVVQLLTQLKMQQLLR
jgi:hypothetical protein